MSFDGNDDYLDCGTRDSLKVGGPMQPRWSFWAKPTDFIIINHYDHWLSKGNTNGNMVFDIQYVNRNYGSEERKIKFSTQKSYASKTVTSAGTVPYDTWHMVSITWDGATTIRMYIDGTLDKTDNIIMNASDFPSAAGLPCSVGRLASAGGSFSKGSMDELAIWNRTLSSQEIQSLYSSGQPVSCAQFNKADTNPQDVCVSMSELQVFINRWKVSNTDVTLKELIEAIGEWKRGCP